MALDYASHTNARCLQRYLRRTELRLIASPNHSDEPLVRVGLSRFRNVGCELEQAAWLEGATTEIGAASARFAIAMMFGCLYLLGPFRLEHSRSAIWLAS